MSAEEASTMSKSAKKRANAKARAAEAEVEAPAPQPEPKAKAKAKAKATPEAPAPAAPAPKADAKAKAKAKAKAEPAPAAEAAPKAKAKAKAEPTAAAEPKKAAQPKKAANTKAGATKPAAKPEPEPEEKSNAPLFVYEVDDGSRAGEWETSTGVSKKTQRRKENQAEVAEMVKAQKSGSVIQAKGNQHIPGLAPAEVQMADAKGGKKANAKASQAVGAVAVVSAAAVADKGAMPQKAAPADNSVSVTIKVPEAKIGRVVGPKGATVNMIKEKTGVKTIDMSGDMCTIVGPQDGVTIAEHAVRQLIEKGYMSLAYEDFEEEGVPLHPSLFPDIIGQKGAIIQEIKKQAKVEIDIPAVPKNGPAGKKYKVTLAGTKASVLLAKEILTAIELYGHHELTHPGQTHTEMEVESWRYAFIIGSKGSEMRHIQNNFKVRVSIPREFSTNRNVVVVGDPRDVERAVKHIEKALYESEQPRGRGAADKAEDTWGEEGDVEDWMRPYMYQRK